MVQKLKTLLIWGVLILLAYMPFHLFLSRWISLHTGFLGQWDSAKDIFTIILLGISIYFTVKEKLFKYRFVQVVFLLAGSYFVLHILYFLLNGQNLHERSFLVATLYNGRIIAWLYIGLVTGLLLHKLPTKTLVKIILIASTITCIFAVIQYIAPKDLMETFGYSVERGAKPNFFIDDKPDLPRVMSTIRDPNSYGAYLILPITLLFVMFVKKLWNRWKATALFAINGIALILTFSRSAWIGTILALGFATSYLYAKEISKFIRKFYPLLIILFGSLLLFTYVVRDTYIFQNVILHSDEATVQADPNELRLQLQTMAVDKIQDEPLGHGPGTAGLASIGNPNGTFLTENYYLQIAYEIGVLGLVLFIAILLLTLKGLFELRDEHPKVILIGSLIAYIFIGFLIHLWANEAVAAQWWLLAGLYIGNNLRNTHNKKTAKN